MSYSPETRKELEDLRDAIDAALRGEPVQLRTSTDPRSEWKTYGYVAFDYALPPRGGRYRPAPKKVKLRYRRCVRRTGSTGLYVDTVTDGAVALADVYHSTEAMEGAYNFVRWLDDDWVEVKIEAPK